MLDMVVAEDLASTQYIHGLGWLSDELLGYITTGRDASSDRSLEYLNVLHTAELRDMEATDITHANVVHAAVQSGEVVKSRDAAVCSIALPKHRKHCRNTESIGETMLLTP